ncbi:MAG: type 1 glutamine amidotransferase [Actinomycetes bacterium]
MSAEPAPAGSDRTLDGPTTLLVVVHEPDAGPGVFGQWLVDLGVVLEICHPYAGDELPSRVVTDGLMVLGGSMGATEDHRAPWLTSTRELIASAVADEVPFLGICLGAQLLATACGGVVRAGAYGPQVGVYPVEWAPAAASDRLTSGLPAPAVAVQWHWDEVASLPAGATVLATDPLDAPGAPSGAGHGSGSGYVQAFRVGETAWGVQFHPEVLTDTVEAWAAGDAEESSLPQAGIDPASVVAAVQAATGELIACWQPLAARFATVLADHRVVRAATGAGAGPAPG